MSSEIITVENKTIGVNTTTPKDVFPIENLIEAIEKYAENYKDTSHHNNYTLGCMLSRMAKNKRNHSHYLKVFIDLYFDNLIQNFPQHQEYLKTTKKKIEEIKKELAEKLETSKVDDETMLPRLLGMIEGLL
jgi:hypothetical protein